MPDLNATMFYKVKFSISAVDPDEDLLWKIVQHIKRWQTRKCRKRGTALVDKPQAWGRLKRGGRIAASDGTVRFRSEQFCPGGSARYWACRIEENILEDKKLAGRKWITEIGYEQEQAGTAVFSCVVSYSDRAGFIGPYQSEPAPSIPNLILNIIDDRTLHTFCGPDELKREPQKLSVGEWPRFVERMMDAERQLPYILVSPQVVDRAEKKVSFLVDYEALAKKLHGNAVVFYFDDPDFSREMDYLNEEYGCYGGAVRAYQPNVREANRHRYLSMDDILEYGKENIPGFLVRAFAQNVNFYDTFFCIEECRKRMDEFARKKRLTELQEAHKAQLSQVESAAFKLALEAEERANRCNRDFNEERRKNHDLEAQVEQHRGAAEENSGLRKALDARNELSAMPENVEDVVAYFSRTFADKLVFSADAMRSLKGCTIEPADLWRDLFALANTMRDLYKNGGGDIFRLFQEQTGISAKRGEGAETRKNKALMRQYETEINGEKIDIEAHITYAKQGQSIHFGYSPKLKKVVVGHCGEHLDNHTTRKAKK